MLELDHFFVCVANESIVVKILTDFGLELSQRQVHLGQGTANRIAFFDNAYLELLLKNSDRNLQSKPVQTISLWQRMRWQETNASPFGVAFRFAQNAEQSISIETIDYDAPFLPDGITIPVATPQNSIREPLIFFSLIAQAPIEQDKIDASLLQQKGRQRKLTGIKITTLPHNPSPQLQWFRERQLISVVEGTEHHAELEWDNGKAKQAYDFRPLLPLSIRW